MSRGVEYYQVVQGNGDMVIVNERSHSQSENHPLNPKREVVVSFRQRRRIVNSSKTHSLVLRRAADGPMDDQDISSFYQNITDRSTKYLKKAFGSIRSPWQQ